MSYNEFAKIYDELINEDIDYNQISNRILEICNEQNINFNNYLDLACGTGNVTVKLANKFKESIASDLSEDMISEAKIKFKKEKVKCKLSCENMTNFNINKEFDLITSVLDASNYIIEDEDFYDYFMNVRDHLKESGLFIFDINSYYKLSEVLGNNIYTYSEEKIFYSWENVFEDDIVNMNLTFFVKNGELYERFEEEHKERAYTETYIESLLDAVGFTLIAKYDGYTNNAVKDDSERIVYVVKG